jgi:predicted alpha/beta superfamily hydrolase
MSHTVDRKMPAAATVRVHYPLAHGRIVLRGEPDWTVDVEAHARSRDGEVHEFRLPLAGAFTYCKPVIVDDTQARWAVGDNYLALANHVAPVDVYPYFSPDQRCSACELHELRDASGRQHSYRVFYPPGYHENTLRRYPTLYMQDGQNLFFPQEAFQGQHWRVAETLGALDAMNACEQAIVIGIYPNQRERDYTRPGYEAYGRFLVDTLKPHVDAEFRTLTAPAHTAVMGSSLGGVVSFYLAWQYPQVFGMAACMSSTFGWRDDLKQRVATESRRDLRIYLDSGWPRDNYEVTRDMRLLLRSRGFREGHDLHYYAFPQALHNEQHWAMRCHLPFQLFFGHHAPAAPARADARAADREALR